MSDWIKQAVREKKRLLPESETTNNEKTTPNVDGAGARQDIGGSPNSRGANAGRRRHGLRTRRLAFDCMSRNAREHSLAPLTQCAGVAMAPVGW